MGILLVMVAIGWVIYHKRMVLCRLRGPRRKERVSTAGSLRTHEYGKKEISRPRPLRPHQRERCMQQDIERGSGSSDTVTSAASSITEVSTPTQEALPSLPGTLLNVKADINQDPKEKELPQPPAVMFRNLSFGSRFVSPPALLAMRLQELRARRTHLGLTRICAYRGCIKLPGHLRR